MTILVLDFCKQNFLHLSDDYTRLFSTKDATGKVWTGLTDQYEVFTCWDSVLLLLNCKAIRNLKHSFPFPKPA